MRRSFTLGTRHSEQFGGRDRTGDLLCGIENPDIVPVRFRDDNDHTGIEPGLRGGGCCHAAQFTGAQQWFTNDLCSARRRDDR